MRSFACAARKSFPTVGLELFPEGLSPFFEAVEDIDLSHFCHGFTSVQLVTDRRRKTLRLTAMNALAP